MDLRILIKWLESLIKRENAKNKELDEGVTMFSFMNIFNNRNAGSTQKLLFQKLDFD